MSVRELWAIAFSKTIIALSTLIGTAAGVASAVTLKAVGDETYYYLLLFAIAPVVVNIGSGALISAWVFYNLRRRSGDVVPIVSNPTAVTTYFVALPVIAVIYFLKMLSGGLGHQYLGYVLTIAPLFYLLIAEFFYYVVFMFIAPSVWQRPHVYPSEDTAETRQPNPELLAPRVTRTVTIGDTSINEADLVFLQAQGNYLRIVTTTAESMVRSRISSAVELLGCNTGLFVHRSYWVAFGGIEHVSLERGKCMLHMVGGEVISVASTRHDEVLAALELRRIAIT
jgi:hypothetical protein